MKNHDGNNIIIKDAAKKDNLVEEKNKLNYYMNYVVKIEPAKESYHN